MLRLFLPIEFNFQGQIRISPIQPIYLAVVKPGFSFAGKQLSILSILIIISITGSVLFSMKLFQSYLSIHYVLDTYKSIQDTQNIDDIFVHGHQIYASSDLFAPLLTKINQELGKEKHFILVSDANIQAPFIFGLYHPVIALPEIKLSKDEWYYILIHEISHFYQRDLWIRFFFELLRIIYWWNPLIYLLQKRLIDLQEIQTDLFATKHLNETQKMDYLECLIHVAKQQSFNPNRKTSPFHKDIATFSNKTTGKTN